MDARSLKLSFSSAVLLSTGLFCLITFSGPMVEAQKKDDFSCEYIYPIEQGYISNHIKSAKRDSALQVKVIDQYIKRIDSMKLYLLSADVEKIRGLMSNAFKDIENKKCGFLNEVQKILVQRVKDRADFAKTFLGKDFKHDTKAEFIFDPDKKPYAKTQEEANKFLENYIHFQVANYIANDVKMDEAKQNVIKNYERAYKRTNDTSQDEIFSDYVDSFARSLDPHSSFFSRSSYSDFQIDMNLKLEGIGATLSQQDGFTEVEGLVPGGPADKSGQMEPKDRIISVGKSPQQMENVIDMDLKDVVAKIRGPKGSKVFLTILRRKGDGKERFDVVLVRDEIKLEDQAASILYLDKTINGQKKKIGVINLPSFYLEDKRGGRSAANDVKKLLIEAKAKKVDGIVFDLSTNSGGSLPDSVKIAGLFFKTGNVVKQSSNMRGREEVLADQDSAVEYSGPLVVLTSRLSASASEIVAGTLQDYKRAVIVGGDHTFGKGTVQTVMRIPGNLGALKVTIGMFYVPGGKSTQHRGVDADIVLPGLFSTDEVGEKSLDYSLAPTETAPFLSESAYVSTGDQAWKTISPNQIKVLREKSTARVEKNEEFKKILDEANKAKERGKIVRVSEVLKDKNEKEKKARAAKNASKEDKNKEYLKRADLNEAVQVLVDLMVLEDPKLAARN